MLELNDDVHKTSNTLNQIKFKTVKVMFLGGYGDLYIVGRWTITSTLEEANEAAERANEKNYKLIFKIMYNDYPSDDMRDSESFKFKAKIT